MRDHSRLARFVVAAGVVFLVNLVFAAAVLSAGGSPVLAAAVAYFFTVLTHFSIQRWWVFGDRRSEQLPIRQQLPPYLVTVLLQWALVAATVGPVSRSTGLDERIVYVCAVVLAAACSFTIFARIVFRVARA